MPRADRGADPAFLASASRERQVGHEELAPAMVESEIVDGEDTHPQRHRRPDGVEVRVEGILGDRHVGDAHRHDAVRTPHEQQQGCLDREHLECAAPSDRVVALERLARGLHEQLEGREFGVDADLGRRPVLVGVLKAVSRVDLGLDLDGLCCSALDAQRLGLVAARLARCLHLHRAAQRVRVVLQRDRAQRAPAPDIHLDEAALDEPGGGHDRVLTSGAPARGTRRWRDAVP